MSQNNLENLIKLSELDKEITNLETQKASNVKENETFTEIIRSLNGQVETANQNLSTLKKNLHNAELELKILDNQDIDKKNKLENAASGKEYTSLEHEIAIIKKNKNKLEITIFNLWQEIEKAQDSTGNLQVEIEAKIENIKKEIEENKDRIARFEEQINRLIKNRPELESNVNPDELKQYLELRQKIKNPMVPVHGNSCSACAYVIPNHDLNQLKHGQLIKCKNCFRLLYWPIPVTQ